MLGIERVRKHGKTKYLVIDIGSERRVIAEMDGLKEAGCMLRFLKGAHLQPPEYQLVIATMTQIDAKEGSVEDAKAGQ